MWSSILKFFSPPPASKPEPEYIVATLKLVLPHVWKDPDPGLKAWYSYEGIPYPEYIHHRIIAKSGTTNCYACEGGFSLPKTERDDLANKRLAKERGETYYNYKPMRDLRFSRDWDNKFGLSMGDKMPWTREELDKLIAALEAEGIIVTEEPPC
jgi:hypothetical protein